MKSPQSQQPTKQTNNVKFKKWAYVIALINFISIIGLSIFKEIKDTEPPAREQYTE